MPLAFERDAALPRLHDAAANAEAAVGQGAFVVDLDGASEAAAGRARALGIVEGEERGRRFAKFRAVVGTNPRAGKAEFVCDIFR